ncbi:MAG: ATP-binding protein [Clostridium sp.]|nr:ATP-binding protein [Clostridium sp.]
MTKDKFAIDFLTNMNNLYLATENKAAFNTVSSLLPKDLCLYHVEEISFEDQAPRKEALENVLSAMKIDGINFVYLILGDESGVHFYYGVAKDLSREAELDLSIQDIGEYVLESSIKGNFRGSKIATATPEEKSEILDKISQMKYYSMLEGVPGSTKDNERFQGVDRLVDVMLGDTFGYMIIAKPLNYEDIKEIEDNLYELYSRVVPFSKKSQQDGKTQSVGTSTSKSSGVSESVGENYSRTTQDSTTESEGTNSSKSKGTNKSTTKGSSSGGSSSSTSSSGSEGSNEGTSTGTNYSKGKTTGESITKGNNTSKSTNSGVTEGENSGETTSSSITLEFVDKKAQDWIKYLDDVIIPRLDYGMGKGVFVTSSFLFSNNMASLKKLENTTISLYSGEKGNKIPLKATRLDGRRDELLNLLKSFQVPFGEVAGNITENELISRSALSQYVSHNKHFFAGSWITTNELSMIAGLPQKEVVGLSLKEEVEFGLNFKSNIAKEERINLGKLVQSGNVIDKIDVYLDKRNMDKHIFVTGVTGSGKTTTCQKILIDSSLPFLIIEPAKTEYRILTQTYDDLIVFTLGKDFLTPFRLNPFEFFKHESITSRVDMIKASIEASFDMEAAIPQLIESAIYECYEDYGWNISTNRNNKYEDPFADGVYAFPTLEDLINKVEQVVEKQGFDQRLKNDYVGSIKARLQGLLIGSKGMMLNTKRSINFEDLLERRVVLELEEIRSATEKSLIMGFVLINLMEAIKARFQKKGAYHHVTLVEEAHRLLSKYSAGDSLNKKQGVETFADMLAEIRKYGESLIIVDQIPNKLTPEVLKNTNTKIVHKIFAQDDKDAIGNTIVLDKEQKEFLSNLETGRAVVFTQGFNKALQVQVDNLTNTTSNERTDERKLQEIVYRYYAEHYKRGIIQGSDCFKEVPTISEINSLMELSREQELLTFIADFIQTKNYDQKYSEILKKYIKRYDMKLLSRYLTKMHYSSQAIGKGRYKADDEEVIQVVESVIEKCMSEIPLTASERRRFYETLL